MNAWTTATMTCRRMAAAACLLAFCFGPAKLSPFVFAISADVEGAHSVRIERRSDGDTKLVLQHSRAATEGSTHHHGVASKLICWVANSDDGSGDHIAWFATGACVECSNETRVHSRGSVEMAAVGVATIHHLSPATVRIDSPRCHAAVGPRSFQRCLRSTCLII